MGLLLCLVVMACAEEPQFDFASACSTAEAPARTANDVRRITNTINNASSGRNYSPEGEAAERWTAAVLLAEAARQAAAPYAVPSEFHRHLPKEPDTGEVHRLQQRLEAACEE